jgi:hypothetical protein
MNITHHPRKNFRGKTAVYRSFLFITAVSYCAGAVHLRKPRSTAVRTTAVRKRRVTPGPNRDLKSSSLPSLSHFAKQSDRTAVFQPSETAVLPYIDVLLVSRALEHRRFERCRVPRFVVRHTVV